MISARGIFDLEFLGIPDWDKPANGNQRTKFRNLHPSAHALISALAAGGGRAGSAMLAFYNANVPEWKNVDYYNEVYKTYECKSGIALGAFKALASSCKDNLLEWEMAAARYMNDETDLLRSISKLSEEIQQLRHETYDKSLSPVTRQSHYRRMQTLNAYRNRRQANLNVICDVLILICRRVRKLRGVNAGDASLSEALYEERT